MKHYQLELN